MKSGKNVMIKMPHGLVEKLDKIADASFCNRSELLRTWIREKIKEEYAVIERRELSRATMLSSEGGNV